VTSKNAIFHYVTLVLKEPQGVTFQKTAFFIAAVPPKRQFLQDPHGITSQNTAFFIAAVPPKRRFLQEPHDVTSQATAFIVVAFHLKRRFLEKPQGITSKKTEFLGDSSLQNRLTQSKKAKLRDGKMCGQAPLQSSM
jgi:hypothetical protein